MDSPADRVPVLRDARRDVVLAALRRCATAGPFFTVTLDESAHPAGRPGADLQRPGVRLAAAIDTVRRGTGATDRRVAASLLFISYTGRLLSAAIGGVLLSGVLLDLGPDRLRWAYQPGSGMRLWITAAAGRSAPAVDHLAPGAASSVSWSATGAGGHPIPGGADRPAAESARFGAGGSQLLLPMLRDELIGGHLCAVVGAIRELVPVSPRVLWGNAASSVAGALGALAATAAVPADVCRTAGDVLLDLTPLSGTGAFAHPAGAARPLQFRRSSCCLYYRLPGAGLCPDCVLHRRPAPPGRPTR